MCAYMRVCVCVHVAEAVKLITNDFDFMFQLLAGNLWTVYLEFCWSHCCRRSGKTFLTHVNMCLSSNTISSVI